MVKYDIKIFMKTAVRNIVDPPRINLVSNDHNGNEFDFTIYHDNRVVMDLTGKRVTLIVKSPSGAIVQDFCTVTSATEGKATITLKTSMFQEAGEYYVEVQVYDDNSRATSAPFNYTVRRALDANELVVTSNEFSVLQEALVNVDAANKIANETKVIADEVKNTSNQALLSATAAKETVDILTPKVAQANTDATNALNNATSAKNTMDALTPVITKAGTDAASASSVANTAKTVSDQALTAATSAKSTVDTLVPKVTQAAADANTALEKANDIVAAVDLKENALLDSYTDLEMIDTETINTTKVILDQTTSDSDFTILLDFIFQERPTSVHADRNQFLLCSSYVTTNLDYIVISKNALITKNANNPITLYNGQRCRIIITHKNRKISLFLNGELIDYFYRETTEQLIINGNRAGAFGIWKYWKSSMLYKRILTPKEIQHNFSVLNNSKSINQIKDYKLASDEDHVEMSTGRTLREEYLGVIAPMAKEFTSATNSITVNNCLKSRLVGGKIEGQTVKNIAPTQSIQTVTGTGTSYDGITTHLNKIPDLKPSTRYTLVTIVYENTLENDFVSLHGGYVTNAFAWPVSTIEKKKTGVFYHQVTTKASFESVVSSLKTVVSATTETGTIKYQQMLFESDVTGKITSYVPFGLSSTQAVISNNGQQYTIYEPTIQGETKVMKAPKGTQNWVEISPSEVRDTVTYDYKLESVGGDLGSVPTVADYIDRARKVKVFNTKEIVLNGGESDWVIDDTSMSNSIRFRCKSVVTNSQDMTQCLFSSFNSGTTTNVDIDVATIVLKTLYLRIVKTKLSTPDVTGLKSWLTSNPITVRYQLATPIEVPMTDEELRAYDVYRKVLDLGGLEGARNTFEFMPDGSAVLTQNTYKSKLASILKSVAVAQITDTSIRVQASMIDLYSVKIGNTKMNGDKFKASTSTEWASANFPTMYMFSHGAGAVIQFAIPTSYNTDVLAKQYLIDVDATVEYELATPIVTHIPKELVPSILTDVKNTFKVDSAVAPTNLTVKLPVDRIAEIQAQLDQVTALITTPSNINLTMNYIEDEYNKNENEEGVM